MQKKNHKYELRWMQIVTENGGYTKQNISTPIWFISAAKKSVAEGSLSP